MTILTNITSKNFFPLFRLIAAVTLPAFTAYLWTLAYRCFRVPSLPSVLCDTSENEQFQEEFATDGYTQTKMFVPKRAIATVIGKDGCTIKRIQRTTTTRIFFDDQEKPSNTIRLDAMRETGDLDCQARSKGISEPDLEEGTFIHIRGIGSHVSEAATEIMNIIATVPQQVQENLWVDEKYVGRIIGRGGEQVKSLKQIFHVRIDVGCRQTGNQQDERVWDTDDSKMKCIEISGVSADVNSCKKEIMKIIDECKEREKADLVKPQSQSQPKSQPQPESFGMSSPTSKQEDYCQKSEEHASASDLSSLQTDELAQDECDLSRTAPVTSDIESNIPLLNPLQSSSHSFLENEDHYSTDSLEKCRKDEVCSRWEGDFDAEKQVKSGTHLHAINELRKTTCGSLTGIQIDSLSQINNNQRIKRQEILCRIQTLPDYIDPNEGLPVIITSVVNCCEVFVQLVEMNNELNQLISDLTKYYEKEYATQPIPFDLKKNDLVAAYFEDETWQRARVYEVKKVFVPKANGEDRKDQKLAEDRQQPEGQNSSSGWAHYGGRVVMQLDAKRTIVEIDYCDFGDADSRRLEELRLLDPKFLKLPMQAIRVRLDGIKPIVGNDWPEEAIQCFQSLCGLDDLEENRLFVKSYEQYPTVRICSPRRNGEDVTALLVEAGFAAR